MDVRLVLDERRDGFHFDSSRLETRYRFFDEGISAG